MRASACAAEAAALAPGQTDGRYFRCSGAAAERGGGGGGGGGCVHAEQVCNGVAECADHSDERKAACKLVRRTQPCVTVGGQDAVRPCALPFRYRGARYEGCALDDALGGRPWCPTELDGGGGYASFARWGVCGPGCPTEPRKHAEDACGAY